MSTDINLRKYLPTRYSKILQERIKSKTGLEFGLSLIKMVIQGKRNNNIILAEAVEMATEERKRRLQIAEKLESLTS